MCKGIFIYRTVLQTDVMNLPRLQIRQRQAQQTAEQLQTLLLLPIVLLILFLLLLILLKKPLKENAIIIMQD